MKKKITFEIETEASDERIKSYLGYWLRDNFQVPKEAEIKIEDLTQEKLK